jgi:1-deoxy-D-xylulose-5-phosphate synthase
MSLPEGGSQPVQSAAIRSRARAPEYGSGDQTPAISYAGEPDTPLLDTIDSPQDLKRLTVPQLVALAREIRHTIVSVVSQRGGHLAPSLGVVELSIALHYVFDFCTDRLVWDVGHQSYPHKLLTGRRSSFHTLRQWKGISGFPKIEESPYDHFGTGHASTSISAALGMAVGRDLMGEDYSVVAVIGDGALTGGLALEGLNQAGHMGRDLIVILNDNKMSISKNVGALTGYLARILAAPLYNRFRDEIWELLGKLPDREARRMRRLASHLEESLKGLFVPGTLFEELGYRYIGPIDGHSCAQLIRTLRDVRGLSGPVLVHVVTKKGRGYPPAEADAPRFHGVPPLNKLTGRPLSSGGTPTYTEVFGTALVDLASEDSRIVAITAAMPDGTGLNLFAKAFPDRFFDVGIAEQHAVTFAAGLATKGLKPVVAIYSTFLQRAVDQVIHDVCLQKLPVVFALDRAGLVGADGPTHHGFFDLSYLRMIPNITIIAPADEVELRDALYTALTSTSGPVAIRYPRGRGVGRGNRGDYTLLPHGRGVLLRDGEHCAIIAVGTMVDPALQAADLLAEDGCSVAVVNARYVKPLDADLVVRLAVRTRAVATVEENMLAGGFGDAVAEALRHANVHGIRMTQLGLPDRFVEHGSQARLREAVGLSPAGIASAVRSFLESKGGEGGGGN